MYAFMHTHVCTHTHAHAHTYTHKDTPEEFAARNPLPLKQKKTTDMHLKSNNNFLTGHEVHILF